MPPHGAGTASALTALAASRVPTLSEPLLRVLRVSYNVGMAAAWPLLANLAVVLLPADRSLWLLGGCLGVGHEDSVLAHALCGTAVWVWACAHAGLTQAAMLVAGLWRVIMLPPWDGSEAKATSNFMGFLAWLALCVLGATSLAAVRRRLFNFFQRIHLIAAPVVLLLGCLHDSKVFWYSMLGAVLYGADLVQRWILRRRAVTAFATVYPLDPPVGPSAASAAASSPTSTTAVTVTATATTAAGVEPSPPGPAAAAAPFAGGLPVVKAGSSGSAAVVVTTAATAANGGSGSQFVVLRLPTRGPPGCVAGQHVWIKVPDVSPWEWHPYSVAAHDGSSFAVVIKSGGDWERRLCRLAERRAHQQQRLPQQRRGAAASRPRAPATAGADPGPAANARIEVLYEGLYGTPDLQVAAAAADRVLLFAGGTGITLVASVLQSLMLLQLPTPTPSSRTRTHPWPSNDDAHRGSETPSSVLTSAATASAAPQAPHVSLGLVGPTGGVGGVRSGGDCVAVGAEEAAAAALGLINDGAQVHLVWAVACMADAQPLLPLIRSAAARGWEVDVHCTRHAPAKTTITNSRKEYTALTCSVAASSTAPASRVANGGGAAAAAAAASPMRSAGKDEADAATSPAVRSPWQLQGAACWAVAAAAVVLGAAGRNLGGAAASTFSCTVPSVGVVLPNASATTAAAGADGISVSEWVGAVRAAFDAAAGGASGPAGDMAVGHSGGAASSILGWQLRVGRAVINALAVLVFGAGAGRDGTCPAALKPPESPMEAAAQRLAQDVDLHGSALGASMTHAAVAAARAAAKAAAKVAGSHASMELRVCRMWGLDAPELCVRCDPFVSRSPLQQAWPCCRAPVCFFAAKLAPLLGWVAGVLLGCLLVCLIWRRLATLAAAAKPSASQPCCLMRSRPQQQGWEALGGRAGGRAGFGVTGGTEREPLLGSGSVGAQGAPQEQLMVAAEEGGATRGGPRAGFDPAREAPGLVGMVAELLPTCDARAGSGGGGLDEVFSAAGGAMRTHIGRPDVESYIRAAVSGHGGSGGSGSGRLFGRVFGRAANGGAVYGVVVCGPESLQAAVQAAYKRHVVGAHPGSWFRAFSFTT